MMKHNLTIFNLVVFKDHFNSICVDLFDQRIPYDTYGITSKFNNFYVKIVKLRIKNHNLTITYDLDYDQPRLTHYNSAKNGERSTIKNFYDKIS